MRICHVGHVAVLLSLTAALASDSDPVEIRPFKGAASPTTFGNIVFFTPGNILMKLGQVLKSAESVRPLGRGGSYQVKRYQRGSMSELVENEKLLQNQNDISITLLLETHYNAFNRYHKKRSNTVPIPPTDDEKTAIDYLHSVHNSLTGVLMERGLLERYASLKSGDDFRLDTSGTLTEEVLLRLFGDNLDAKQRSSFTAAYLVYSLSALRHSQMEAQRAAQRQADEAQGKAGKETERKAEAAKLEETALHVAVVFGENHADIVNEMVRYIQCTHTLRSQRVVFNVVMSTQKRSKAIGLLPKDGKWLDFVPAKCH